MLTHREPSPAIDVVSVTTGLPVETIWRPASSSDQIPEFAAGILFAVPRNASSTTNAAT